MSHVQHASLFEDLDEESVCEKVNQCDFNAHPYPNIAKRAAEAFIRKSLKEKSPSKLAADQNVNQFSLWPKELFEIPENVRAGPNVIMRSAIFTIRSKREKRASIQNKIIYSPKNLEIMFTGIELSVQDDELVWLQVIELAKHQEAETWVNFTSGELCKYIGWGANGTYYQKIHDCLIRLKATAIQIRKKSENKGKAFSMVSDYEWSDKYHRVKIPAVVQTLFANNEFSYLQWQQYRKLSPIAKKIYAYAVSHTDPNGLLLETVKRICDSHVKQPYKWKQQVKKACAELEISKLIRVAEIRKVSRNDHLITERW